MEYTFHYEGIVCFGHDYLDIEFTDYQEGNAMRLWCAAYEVETNTFTATLKVAENPLECFEDYRRAKPDEIDAMWQKIPNVEKLRCAMFRK